MEVFVVNATSEPFSASKRFLLSALDAEELRQLQGSLRPIFHSEAAPSGSLSDRQTVGEQLRFYTKHRCMRDFKRAAWYLTDKYREGYKVQVTGPANQADLDFFKVLCDNSSAQVAYEFRESAVDPSALSGDQIRVTKGLRTEADWAWIHAVLSGYLNCGDSWRSVWLGDLLLTTHDRVHPIACDILGLAYGLQDRTAEAELLYLKWRDLGGINRARANYSLAMLYARHHPKSFRSDSVAGKHLEDAWQVLRGLDSNDERVQYERIFNRNGYGLILFRRGDLSRAARLLEEGISTIRHTPFYESVHHTVLLNNLGRVYSAMGNQEKAEECLQEAIRLDPRFAEYWFDLASFYVDIGAYAKAEQAIGEAEQLTSTISEVFAMSGYIAQALGKAAVAAERYAQAWSADRTNVDFALNAARNLLDVGQYEEALVWCNQVAGLSLSLDESETRDLLVLEAESQDYPGNIPNYVLGRLEELASQYPESTTIRENIAALKGEVGV